MAMTAVSHIAASEFAGAPSGMGGDYNSEMLLLLVASGGIIFIDHARNGQPQPGGQYAALGIVGFGLLFLGQFAPEFAFAITLLFFISIILNTPNGIPFMSGPAKAPQPGQTGFGVVAPGFGITDTGQVAPLPKGK